MDVNLFFCGTNKEMSLPLVPMNIIKLYFTIFIICPIEPNALAGLVGARCIQPDLQISVHKMG